MAISKEMAQAMLVFLDRCQIAPREIDAFLIIVKELRSILETEVPKEDADVS